jgi:hypothetical protein
LTDADRYDVIEFLKTFNDEGDYRFDCPVAAQLPMTVLGNQQIPLRMSVEAATHVARRIGD